MPRIIVSSRYLKPGTAGKRGGLVKYIATRESVEMYSPQERGVPVTKSQTELVTKLLEMFPAELSSHEYADYKSSATKENASELITEILERNADRLTDREMLVKYISERPGVEKIGKHGLFSADKGEVDLNEAKAIVSNHDGNVWTNVVSLRREDAERLGYTTPQAWQNLVLKSLDKIARAHKIKLDHLRWYAAFHNTAHHPHIHLLVYSTDPTEGYMTENGIEMLKSTFANIIFKDELNEIYQKQTQVRDDLRAEAKRKMQELLSEIQNRLVDPQLEALILKLSRQLENAKGKKVYGYLQPQVKKTVDDIVAMLAADPAIKKMYDEWCRLEQEKYATYTNAVKQFPSLHENKMFKKNNSLTVPLAYVSSTGFKLGQWYNDQLYAYGRNLSKIREIKLRELGVQFDREDTWEQKYMLAKEYFEGHGNISMPANYVSNGVWLSKWLSEQRLIGEGKRKKKLTDEQREKLEAIGVTFGKLSKDNSWDRQYDRAKYYVQKHGSLAPTGNPDSEDEKVIRWIINQRKRYREGKLTDEQKKRLEKIGIVWVLEDSFEIGFAHAQMYYKANGNLLVSSGYVCDDGYTLGNWISNARNRRDGRLSDEQITRLESIGMVWNMNEYRWEQGFSEAYKYYKEYENLNINSHYRTGRSPEVYYWIEAQRSLYREGKLSEEQIKRLESIGMDWLSPVERAWENGFQNVESYVKKNNTTRIPATYRNEKGECVGLWLRRQVDKKDRLSIKI